ncbi:MAG: hypothetical protein NHB14_03760 [Desulfosporosinus sp.]|nr:hypothetical protein [Desulfosporosinus sp.]
MGHKVDEREVLSPPTDYYCESLAPIDEQICELLSKRKMLSENNPGIPSLELITAWCEQYKLNEDKIRSIFASMCNDSNFLPQAQIEPAEFLGFVPIMKSVELDNIFYAVTYMRQYKNASVVSIEVELNSTEENIRLEHAGFKLYISPNYQCRSTRGGGGDKGVQHSFVVTPSLPDDLTGVEFRLTMRPYSDYEKRKIALAKSPITIK